MSVYHQLGHHSENLLREPHLDAYRGAILSPVNNDPTRMQAQVANVPASAQLDVWFDPQLYVPTSDRGSLRTWQYFPTDVDTADFADEGWWERLVQGLVNSCDPLALGAICSPAVLPRAYSDEYFGTLVFAGKRLARSLEGSTVRAIQTAVVALNDLAVRNRPLGIASILSQTQVRDIYLVFVSGRDPRRELADVDELKGAMQLIRLLRGAGLQVTIGYCSSDMLLWKHAGATHCATGKFFNLRRFTRARFDDPTAGGGQLPYWFEESLLAFLRESDLLRIRDAGLLSDASERNPIAQQILAQLVSNPGQAWLGKSWQQYLWWFADAERRVESADDPLVPTLLKAAEDVWQSIDGRILMEERVNDGGWLRAWRRACIEQA